MRTSARSVLILGAALLFGCRTGAAPTPPPPPSAAPPSAVLEALSMGQPVEVLSEVGHYVFDADGRKVYTYKLTYRILNAAALSQWATISADWTPWYQDAPELSATVTTPSGKKYTLDDKSIAEMPAGTDDALLYSDRRRLVAPLPGLEVGALVEQVTVQRDTRPFFAEGAVGRFYFGMRVPVFQSRLILDAPEDVPLAWAVGGVDIEPEVSTEDGRRVVTFRTGPVMPQGSFEPLLPPDVPRYPYVAFSTARNWQGVAARYAALVERQLLGADVRALIEGVETDGRSTRGIATELMRRVHAKVRYTGIEFGRQAIVPWKPKETLARGYGDCKDKSTLLVAMLRAVGVEAHLAILKAGYGEDAIASLPGLESFNHAIVHIPGRTPLWIDATADLTPVGELPSAIQGRRVLVASPSTTDLVRTPEHPTSHARYRETRTVQLAPWGAGTVRETTSASGAMQDKLRAQYSGAPKLRIGEALEQYVKSTYKADSLSSFVMTNPRDLSVPFELSIEADGAHVAYTNAREANVPLRTAVLYSWLPEFLRLAALAGPEEKDKQRRIAADRMLGRSEDVLFPEAYSAELTYVVEMPDGFEVSNALEGTKRSLGPARFEVRYAVEGRRVRATFSLDVVKRRYTADEARAFVVGLYELFEGGVPRIELRHRGARLLAEGRIKDALAVYRRIVEGDPNTAFNHARFADVLLEVGLGTPAREHVRRALALAPDSARVHYAAALVFSHDLFGRRFKPGFDRDAAVRSFRRVLEIEPEHAEAKFSLAVLLEHDERGVRYGNLEGVREAVGLYQSLPKGEGRPNHENNLLIALFEARDFDSLEEAASLAEPSPVRSALLMVSVAVTESINAAFARVDELRLPPAARDRVYQDAATSLTHARRYGLARKLILRAARTSKDPLGLQKQIATLSKLRRFEPREAQPTTPIEVVEFTMSKMFAPKLDLLAIESLFVRVGSEEAVEAAARELTSGFAAFQKAAKESGVPLAAMRDNVMSMTKFHVEGDDKVGYRVGGKVMSSQRGEITWWFVVKERGRYRLRATESSFASLGEEALHLVVQKKPHAARKWLNWAKEIMPHQLGADPLTEHPFVALWSGGTGPIRLSAAALQATGARGSAVINALEKERKKRQAPEVRMHIDHALVLALIRTQDTAKTVEVATRLYRQLPKSDTAYSMYCGALIKAGRQDEVVELLSKRLDKYPRDVRTRARLSDLLTRIGDNERAEQVMRDGIRIGVATPTMYNNLAWLRLFSPDVGPDDVEIALEANVMTSFENPSHLHTLAALYAEEGKTREALQLVLRRMELSGRETPNSADWYLLGRIMQDYGLVDLAREAYGRVENDEDRPTDSTWALARMKLRALAGQAPGERI